MNATFFPGKKITLGSYAGQPGRLLQQPPKPNKPLQPLKRQHGVVLIIALIVLVAMTLAGIALVRSVDTSNMIAGNLGFKQGTTAAGDAGIEAGIGWLKTAAGTATSYQDQPDFGYYATSQDALDMTGSSQDPNRALVDWDFNNCNNLTTSNCITPAAAIDTGAGNLVSYIIHRLCPSAGAPNSAANSCASYQNVPPGTRNKDDFQLYIKDPVVPLLFEYYRITSRVKGPRNTISFVETVIHL